MKRKTSRRILETARKESKNRIKGVRPRLLFIKLILDVYLLVPVPDRQNPGQYQSTIVWHP